MGGSAMQKIIFLDNVTGRVSSISFFVIVVCAPNCNFAKSTT